MLEELTPLHELHSEVDPRWRVEAVLEPDQERVSHLLQNILLGLDLLDLVSLNQISLIHDLHGVELPVVLLLGQDNLPESSSTQDPDNLEIVLGQLFPV